MFCGVTATPRCFAKYDKEFKKVKGEKLSFSAVRGGNRNANYDLLCHKILLQLMLSFHIHFWCFIRPFSRNKILAAKLIVFVALH